MLHPFLVLLCLYLHYSGQSHLRLSCLPPPQRQASFRPLSPRAVTPSPQTRIVQDTITSGCHTSTLHKTSIILSTLTFDGDTSRQGSFEQLSPWAVTPSSPPWSQQGSFRPLSPWAVMPSHSSSQVSFCPLSTPIVTPPTRRGSFKLLSPWAVTPSSPPWSRQGSFRSLSPWAVTPSPSSRPASFRPH